MRLWDRLFNQTNSMLKDNNWDDHAKRTYINFNEF